MGVRWGAVRSAVASDRRDSWRAWVAIGVLVGATAGVLIAAADGAQRTASSYDRLVAETNAGDVFVVPDCGPAPCEPSVALVESVAAELARVPGVRDVGGAFALHLPVLDADGEVLQIERDACFTGNGEVSVVAPVDGRVGHDLNTYRYIEGRAPRPGTNEAVVSADIARDLGVAIGDVLSAHFEAKDCNDQASWGTPTELRVVGIGIAVGFIRPESGFYSQAIHVFTLPKRGSVNAGTPALVVQLGPGVSVADLRRRAGDIFVVADLRDAERSIENGLNPDATALWLVTILGGATALLVLGQTLVRHARTLSAMDDQLGAIGWSTTERRARGAAHGLLIAAVAMVTATIVAAVGSTRTPIGDGRAIEPDPAVRMMSWPLAVGLVAVIAFSVLTVAGASWAHGRRVRSAAGARLSGVAEIATRLDASPAAVLGLRVGLEPGRLRAPVRSTVVAVALAAAGIVGVLAYTYDAEHLRHSPRLVGADWDAAAFPADGRAAVDLENELRQWPEVGRTGGWMIFLPDPVTLRDARGGTFESRPVAFDGRPGAIVPPVIEGRVPRAAGELLVAAPLARRHGIDLGDVLEGAIVPERRATFEVVGIGPIAAGAGFTFEAASALTLEGVARLVPVREVEPHVVLVEAADGQRDELRARLAAHGLLDPEADSDDIVRQLVGIDTTRTEATPQVLGLLLTLLAAGSLAHGIGAIVRARRRDVAVARTLGFTRRQVDRTLVVAAATIGGAISVLALPVGLIAGHRAWRQYARSLGVITDYATPWSELVVMVAAVVVVGAVLAVLAGRSSTRRPPAEALRAE